MKINFVQALIAIAICALTAYGLYSLSSSENKLLLSVGGFLFMVTTLIFAIAASFEFHRTTTNIRAVSVIFFIMALSSNMIFAFISFAIPSYIIINGILLVIFLSILYSINKAKQ